MNVKSSFLHALAVGVAAGILLCAASVSSQPARPSLQFNPEGQFKIVQFTDIHMKEYYTGKRDSLVQLVSNILAAEKPDLVVLTGDIATSGNVEAAWKTVVQPMIDAKIPWTAVFGNHDAEHGWNNEKMGKFLMKLPYNVSLPDPVKMSGYGNFVLEVKDSKGKKTAALLYCIDSGDYSPDTENPELGTYDWIKHDQVEWYRQTSQNYTRKNGNSPLPALAFFHIPLPEYNIVQRMESTVGDRDEEVCSPVINTGMFYAMIEMKDVMGTFVGHDHNNNYIGMLNNICLAYGCKTGLESYGDYPKGARVIVLKQGRRQFDTWIHTTENNEKYRVSFPDTFVTNKETNSE